MSRPHLIAILTVTFPILFGLTNAYSQELLLSEVSRFPDYQNTDPDNFIAHMSDMVLLPSGDIAIADWMQSQIHILSLDGQYLRTLGRPGQGPGEFDHVSRLAVDQVNQILWASDNRAIHAFSLTDWTYLRSISPPATVLNLFCSGDELYVVPGATIRSDVFIVYDGNGNKIREEGQHLDRETQDRGVLLHKTGWGDAKVLDNGRKVSIYAYSIFNDIILIEDGIQKVLHIDDTTVAREHAENIEEAKRWDQDRNIIPSIMLSRVVLRDGFFYLVAFPRFDNRILEVGYDGDIRRSWRIPASRSYIRSLHVIEEGNRRLFITLDIEPDPQVILYEGFIR